MFKTCFFRKKYNHYYEIPHTFNFKTTRGGPENNVEAITLHMVTSPVQTASSKTNLDKYAVSLRNQFSPQQIPPPIPPRRTRKYISLTGELIPITAIYDTDYTGLQSQCYVTASTPSPTIQSPTIQSPNKPSPNKPSPNKPSPNKPSPNKLSPNKTSPNIPSPQLSYTNMPQLNNYLVKPSIEPLFTIEINIKNERTGLVSTRKFYM